MVEHSQNGWVASSDRAAIGVVPLTVAGVEFVGGVRGGDVHWLFVWALAHWNRDVEKLVSPGCWGYAYRPNRNDPNVLTNHASGTAVDINAPKHPDGVKGTFSSGQRQAIRRLCDLSEGALRSGEFYTHTTDGMHLEVNVTPAQLAPIVKRLQARAAPRTYPVLKYGSRGVAVAAFTNALRTHGFPTTDTDRYQSPTVKQVERLQRGRGWTVTGTAGEREHKAVGL